MLISSAEAPQQNIIMDAVILNLLSALALFISLFK